MTAHEAALAAEAAIRAIPVTDETVSYRAQALHAINGLLDEMAFERARDSQVTQRHSPFEHDLSASGIFNKTG